MQMSDTHKQLIAKLAEELGLATAQQICFLSCRLHCETESGGRCLAVAR